MGQGELMVGQYGPQLKRKINEVLKNQGMTKKNDRIIMGSSESYEPITIVEKAVKNTINPK